MFAWCFILLGAVGLILMFITPGHAYWNLVWMAVLGWFLLNAARGSWRFYILSSLTARDGMKPIDQQTAGLYATESKVVSADMMLDKVMQIMYETDFPYCLVENENGKIIGMIDPRDVVKLVSKEAK